MAEGSWSRFTAAEGGARLAAAARHRNTIAAELSAFVSTRLLHEEAYTIRGPFSADKQRSVYVTRASRVPCVAYELRILTDLAICEAASHQDVEDWEQEIEVKEVLVCTSAVFRQLLEDAALAMARVNVLVVDSCHLVHTDEDLQVIMGMYKSSPKQPRVLGLTYPLFTSRRDPEQNPDTPSDRDKEDPNTCAKNFETEYGCEDIGVYENVDDFDMYGKLEWNIEQLEQRLCSHMDLAEDIDGGKRFTATVTKPKELIVEYSGQRNVCQEYRELEDFMRTSAQGVTNFLEEHRFTATVTKPKELIVEYSGQRNVCQEYRELEDFMRTSAQGVTNFLEEHRFTATVTKPKELIVEYSAQRNVCQEYRELEDFMRTSAQGVTEFLEEHRYDPTEIYGEDLYEEFMNIPNPTIDPKLIFKQFLYVLDELGPYGADKAAFTLLTRLEKLKIKVPYERHFLLLCLCTTVLVKIRCYADQVFSNYSELDRITTFSTPKVLRFIEILEQFECPEENKGSTVDNSQANIIEGTDSNKENIHLISKNEHSNDNEDRNSQTDKINDKLDNKDDVTRIDSDNLENCYKIDETVNVSDTEQNDKKNNLTKLLEDIDKCDFITLSNKLEDKVNTYKANLKEIHDDKATDSNVDTALEKLGTKFDPMDPRSLLGFPRRPPRVRGRGRVQRNAIRNQQMQQNPDALCGIVFMNEPIMAKIMFLLVVELSHTVRLAHVSAQYCAAAPARDAAELRRHCRAREDALKKFRMHDCNLLLATSALEEGIDLPRCNLVLRWDVPNSYRSHGLCRGRARAPRSACVLLTPGADSARTLLRHVAVYRELDQIISRKCGCGIQDEPPQEEEDHADTFTTLVLPYTPSELAKAGGTNEKELDRESVKEDVIDKSNNETYDNKLGVDFGSDNIDINSKIDETTNVEMETKLVRTRDELNDKEEENEVSDNDKLNVNVNNDNNESKSKDKIENSDMDLLCDKIKLRTSGTNIVCECKERTSVDKCVKCKSENLDKEDKKEDLASVDLSSAIALINRYCGKLPSDTFTRLAPSFRTERVLLPSRGGALPAWVCTLRLPLNCPVKHTLVGHPMPSVVLARRAAALQACRALHRAGELDHQLLPIGKENFKAGQAEGAGGEGEGDARPGTTKRRQYYYKRTARAFTDCEPIVDTTDEQLAAEAEGQAEKTSSTNVLYAISCTLWCALPERYNTRGRRLHAPQLAAQAQGVLLRDHPPHRLQIPAFPVYTRSGEVRVAVAPATNADTRLTPRRKRLVLRFMRFVFSDVLRVRRRGMTLQSAGSTRNNYYVVPTVRVNNPDGSTQINIDWKFLEEIYQYTEDKANSELERPMLWPEEDDDPKRGEATEGKDESVEKRGEANEGTDEAVEKRGEATEGKYEAVENRGEAVVAKETSEAKRGETTIGKDEDLEAKQESIVAKGEDSEERETGRSEDKEEKQVEDASEVTLNPTEDQIKDGVKGKKDVEPRSEANQDARRGSEASQYEDTKTESHKRRVTKIENPLLKPGEVFVFDAEKYREAVVTPWYRNRDQPQFFLVAEICTNLTPDSEFPSETHTSFREYYKSKYGVTLTQPNQPLLDVDHTSARLNLLTPRYVNRKGVALPVSSERTRRAKRDRLDQKQILVPELCAVHPFAAPLWFATVALPCVLYRINALLIADEIRRQVARAVGLGVARPHRAAWPPLDFGWSLAEVLNADSEKNEKKKGEDEATKEEDEAELKEEDQKESNENPEPKEKTINDILQEKEDAESGFEIGTWDNDMAASIPETPYDEFLEPLPPNLTFCTSASGGANWCDPVQKPKSQFKPSRTFSMADSDCSYMSSDFDTDDSDLNSEGSDETETSGFCSSKSNVAAAMGVRIEYKTAREAEAVDLERARAPPARPAPPPPPPAAPDAGDRAAHAALLRAGRLPRECLDKFNKSVAEHEKEFIERGLLIAENQPIADILPDSLRDSRKTEPVPRELIKTKFEELFPYDNKYLDIEKGPITLEDIEKNKRYLLNEFKKSLSEDEIKKYACFSMIDVDIDSPDYKNEKISNIGFDQMENYLDKVKSVGVTEFEPYYEDNKGQNGKEFDFDFQPNLEGHPGPSPSVILQALTMSNANDGINLERLETIGDSFLKFAITAYLYCAHPTVHEGKLSHMRSKQVSNLNLYRLGLRKRLGARMIASKFEPHDNWLPPCHRAPSAAHAPVDSEEGNPEAPLATGCFIPYNLITQHSIPDKSIADCVEALIGAYLLECGPRGALLFMSWLGIRVLPRHDLRVTDDSVVRRLDDHKKKRARKPRRHRDDSDTSDEDDDAPPRPVGSLAPYQDEKGQWFLPMFGALQAPPSPLLRHVRDPEGELERMLSGYDALERTLQYRFRDRSLLLQALTHASHQRNRLTDCYQRLEFLGDAILDYLITRHLYEDGRRHSPGALTDLRSALVNNTIFATLAARHGFHRYFRHMSPGLNEVLTRYVRIQEENGHSISEEHYLIHEDELEQAEDVEVPKALGDLFESVAGAIFLDSGMSLAAVWKSYIVLMGAELEAFSAAAPKSPVRELLEAEPDTAKFGKPERLADGRRVRVCVEVFGRGAFKGVGRNYRIAKGTAARCALRHLKRHKPH